jgi:hypothetical protein
MKRTLLVIVAMLVNTVLFAANSVQTGTDDSDTVVSWWPDPEDWGDEES